MRIAIFEREGDRKPSFRESPTLLQMVLFRGAGSFRLSTSRPTHDVFVDDATGHEWAAAAVAIAARWSMFGFELTSGRAAYETTSMKAERALDRHARTLERKGGG